MWGRRQQVLQLLRPELRKHGGDVPPRILAGRDQELPGVLDALQVAFHDSGLRRIAFVIRRIDGMSIDLVKMAIGQFDLGPAAAFSIMYFLVILLVSWVFYTVMTTLDKQETK